MSGYPSYRRFRPVQLELNLLIIIARTARVARFVRNPALVNACSKVNWYWLFHNSYRFNPVWYWNMCRERRRQAHLASMGVDGGEAGQFNKPNTKRAPKRSSWGVLQIGVLAAVKAQAEAEAREAKEASSRRGHFRIMDSIKKSLRAMGLLGDERLEIQRQIAATKIQRAWRAHIRYDPASHDGSQDGGEVETDVAWSGRSHATNLDKVLHKRSVMRQYAAFNARNGGRLDRNEIRQSKKKANRPAESRFQSQAGKGRESQVGSDMRERTGQRVAIGVLLALVFTVVFTYSEQDTSRLNAMVVLHEQTMNDEFRNTTLKIAQSTAIPDLYEYTPVNGETIRLALMSKRENADNLREREMLNITVMDSTSKASNGMFAFRNERVQAAWVELCATIFVLLVWFLGVTAFAGPVMSLVVIPIERMVRLLGMLMLDPLGFQNTARFKKFLIEEDTIIKNTRWTKEVLKGMETSFLMSTILRIGSLMKVGFGSAGVEIIRNNLQKGQSKNMLNLTSQGSTVSCIFLFCDIRQFTDATECLQEEVFVFTNRIAAVVHSICHSYGGAANKNVGDAFLLSWLLDDGDRSEPKLGGARPIRETTQRMEALKAKNNQADKALLSVIKICIALYHDKYYIETMSEAARNRLRAKLKNRPGPIVQMGFGLHAGKAVQGAIGSQRKIDATYVSEAVERAEFLESSTKQYGLKMLMSDNFHRLLHPNTRRRCRKVDQILIPDEDDDDDDDGDTDMPGELMELFTFDMDIEALHRPPPRHMRDSDTMSETESVTDRRGKRVDRRVHGSSRQIRRRRSVQIRIQQEKTGSEELLPNGGSTSLGESGIGSPSIGAGSVSSVNSDKGENEGPNASFYNPPELVLPSGPALYSHNVWQTPDMKRIRAKFNQGLFFQKYNSGLQAFYSKDWQTAQECFQTILDNYDDGPSKYFMKIIKSNNGEPPRDFVAYGRA